MARARRAAPSHSRTSPAPPPAQQHHSNNTSNTSAHPTPPQPQVTNAYMPKAGGAGAGILGTMASVAAGSVIGHGLSHMLFDREQAPAQPAQAQEVARQVGDGACAPQIKTYSKCLEANTGNAESCKWVWDDFVQCQNAQQQQA